MKIKRGAMVEIPIFSGYSYLNEFRFFAKFKSESYQVNLLEKVSESSK